MELRGGSWPDQVQLASHTLAADRYSRAARSRASGSVAARGWATGYRAGPAGVCRRNNATLGAGLLPTLYWWKGKALLEEVGGPGGAGDSDGTGVETWEGVAASPANPSPQ